VKVVATAGGGAVAVYSNMTREGFAHITAVKEPAVLKGLNLGPAVDRYTFQSA
jgi:hypothetical protein